MNAARAVAPARARARWAAWVMMFWAGAVAVRHGLRMHLVLRLARASVLTRWPWRAPWVVVAAASGVVVLASLVWAAAWLRRAAWARRYGWALGGIYGLWRLLETWLWTWPHLSRPARAAAGVGLALGVGLWWFLARLASMETQHRVRMANRFKEAS